MNEFMFRQETASALRSGNFSGERERIKKQYPDMTYTTLQFSQKLTDILAGYMRGTEKVENRFYEKLVWQYILEQDEQFMSGVRRKDCETIFKWLFDEDTFNKLCTYALQQTYKKDNTLQGTFHQIVALYYVINALNFVTSESGVGITKHKRPLLQKKRDITVDVYAVYVELKKLFGNRLNDLSLTVDDAAQPPHFSLGFKHNSPIMKPSIEPVWVKEGMQSVNTNKYILILPDAQKLLQQVLLYK